MEQASRADLASRLNWLRAGVLGANDGIVSTAALVVGVAGATTEHTAVLIAGLVGLLAGAMSMAAGEYVSVSTQRDSERAVLDRQRALLTTRPTQELTELAAAYRQRGLDADTAESVARQLTASDGLRAHAQARHGIDPDELTDPWHAAWASLIAFSLGALIPLAGIAFAPSLALTAALVAAALALTGALSARLGDAPTLPAVVRNIGGGMAAMIITFGLGNLVGAFL